VLISICIPAYKQPITLKRVLDSIQQQTFRDFEVIISDDSPGDELKDVISNPQWNFPIRYFKNAPAKGSPGNWNAVVEYAQGDWIKIIHHDDWLSAPDSLSEFAQATIDNPLADFFFCQSWIFNHRINERHLYLTPVELTRKIADYPAALFSGNLIGAPSATMYKRSLKLEYDLRLIWLVDIEFYCRVINQYAVKYIEKPLVTTGAEQEHQLTATLFNNMKVEINEFFYCFNKFSKQFNAINVSLFRNKIIQLLVNYNVHSIAQIRDSGYSGKIPIFVRLYCFLSSIHRGLANRVLNKWNYLELKNYDYR
jgi:glycosyltransferase involved in cell wall biosynthesis